MKTLRGSVQKSKLLGLMAITIGAVYLGGNVWSSTNKLQKSSIQVNNRTQNCQVLSAEKYNGYVKLYLKNDSSKDITAFVISSAISPNTIFKFEEEFVFSEADFVITSGGIYEKQINIPSSLNKKQDLSFDLSAVIFDDKSSEGDQTVVKEILDKRLGEKIQLMRTIPLLERMLALPDRGMLPNFDSFKRELITTLNAPGKDLLTQLEEQRPQVKGSQIVNKLSEQMETGLQTGQEAVLREIQNLEELQKHQGGNALREEIIRIKQTYERILSRL